MTQPADLTTAVSALADRLEVPIEVLWSALLRQAPVSATVSLFLLALVICTAVGFGLYAKAVFKKDEDAGIVVGIITVFLILLSLVAISSLPGILAGFFNPEYWALKQLLE
jgi:hypothetical protein